MEYKASGGPTWIRADNFVDRSKLQSQRIRCAIMNYPWLFDARFFNEPEYAGHEGAVKLFENPEALANRIKFVTRYWPADWEIVGFQHRLDLNGMTVYVASEKFEPRATRGCAIQIETFIIDESAKCVYIGT